MFVHGLGGDPCNTWRYKGPHRDPVSAIHQPTRPDLDRVGSEDAAKDTSGPSLEREEQSNSQRKNPPGHEEPVKRSLARRLKTVFRRSSSSPSSPSSRSNSRADAGRRPRSPSGNRDETKVSHKDNQQRSKSKDNHFFWPQDLPEACASARVMTFGYDSDVSKFFGGAANQNTFYDHAGDLLGNLVRKRSDAVRHVT